jgi:hypothetical protein
MDLVVIAFTRKLVPSPADLISDHPPILPSMTAISKASGGQAGFTSLAKKALQAALIAAPVVFAAAPSEAGTRLVTVKGFTGQFAPVTPSTPWFGNLVDGTATFTPSTLTLFKPAANSGQATRQITISSSLTDALKLQPGMTFLQGQVSYDWTTVGSTQVFALNAIGPYTTPSNNPPVGARTLLNSADPDSGSYSQTIQSGDTFGFQLLRIGGTVTGTPGDATAVISNFAFTAEYEVPGPLPILGAGAAFAWSRRLRSRLKLSESIG